MTQFRQVQIESICRGQNKLVGKGDVGFLKGHHKSELCGKVLTLPSHKIVD